MCGGRRGNAKTQIGMRLKRWPSLSRKQEARSGWQESGSEREKEAQEGQGSESLIKYECDRDR